MKKIRIGNDIRLAVDLRLYLNPHKHLREREVYNPADEAVDTCSDCTPIGIRSVKAILINNTLKEQRILDFKKKSRFITRFPIEPHIEAFHSTPYDVCSSGYPTWRTYPLWYGRQEHFLCYPHHHYYKGFGPNPHFDGLYRPLPMNDGSEYRANVMATEKQNVVEVSFPAQDLLYTGKYTLIIVAKVFAPGFNNNNLKTITIDFPNVIELVSTSEEGVDSDILGTQTLIIDILPSCTDDVYVTEGSLSSDNKEHMLLNRTDGESIDIDLSPIVGWGDPDKED